jgi:hypothetical protein
MALLILIALAAIAVYLGRLYAFPFKNCRHCGGTGRKHSRLNRRAFSVCAGCAGNGRTLRTGARMLHRTVLEARSPATRDRLRRRDTQAAERAALPGRTTSGPRGSEQTRDH